MLLPIMLFIYTDSSEKLSNLLRNKHLRMILEEIDSSSNPQELLNRALALPVFKEFIDECLYVVDYEASA